MKAWPRRFCKAACAQGWCIFNDTEIQRDDEAGVFDGDDDAIAYVRRQAKRGRPEAIRALEIHGGDEPVTDHTRSYGPRR